MIKTILLLSLMFSLTACMNIATSGAEAVYYRKDLGHSLQDQYINMQAFQALHRDADEFKNTHIIISTYHQDILLAGQVPQMWQKQKAEAIVKAIPGVLHVYNELEIASPSASLVRMSDAWITTKIKSQMIASEEVDASKIKVVTENGTVYLLGTVPHNEANAAVSIAKDTNGVTRVVKIFAYLTIENGNSAELAEA